ncbi:MAG: SDR family oxidoreductase [Rhodospirillaceae bacterium]
MDLGIAGRNAVVCAASKGLGRACAESLAREGANVTICARTPEPLAAAAEAIDKLGSGTVTAVAADVATEDGRATELAACPEPDILVNNAGGPPPGDFRDWDRDAWLKALDANMLAPVFMIKASVDGMIGRKWGRVVNITSGAVKSPVEVLGLSNGARAGLTGFVAGLARKTVAHNVTINNLLPTGFDTDRMRSSLGARAKAAGVPEDQMLQKRMDENPSKRLGRPNEFGDMCAFLCSDQMGFVTGQNILMDGGMYPGTF